MIERLFIGILNMSLTGSFVILAVLMLRLFLRKMPRIFSYCLWAAVLFRLLCPVSFSAEFSPLNILRTSSVEHGRIEYISENNVHSVSFGKNDMMFDAYQKENLTDIKSNPAKKTISIIQIAATIWILGICVIGFYSIVTLIKLRQKLKTASLEKDNIYVTENVSTPFVIGVFHPKIYLPSAIRTEEREYVLLHEQIHLKRGDHIIKLIAFLALCLHWMNPLVWTAFFLSGKDMEMSCDEAVIRKIGNNVKKEYSTSLLSMATGRRIVGGIPLAFGEGDTGSRIKNVLHYKKPAAFFAGLAAIVCIAAVVILMANPNSADTKEKTESSQVYYGVVKDVSIENFTRRLLLIPGIGEIEIPKAGEVYTYFERDEQQLLPGDMVQITFPEGKEVFILETWPASFSETAKSLVVMWSGCDLQYMENGNYLFTFSAGIVPDVSMINTGDILSIYWEEEDSMLIVETPVLSVGETEDGVKLLTIELTKSQVEILFKGFGFHIRFALENNPDSPNENIISDIMWENLITVIGVEDKERYMWQINEINQLEIAGKECFSLDLRYTDDEAKNGVMAGRLFGTYAVSKDGMEFYRYNSADDIWEKINAIN